MSDHTPPPPPAGAQPSEGRSAHDPPWLADGPPALVAIPVWIAAIGMLFAGLGLLALGFGSGTDDWRDKERRGDRDRIHHRCQPGPPSYRSMPRNSLVLPCPYDHRYGTMPRAEAVPDGVDRQPDGRSDRSAPSGSGGSEAEPSPDPSE